MASLKQLIPYLLEKGVTLKGGSGETLTPNQHGGIEWHLEESINRRGTSSRYYSHAEIQQLPSIWDWSAVFLYEKSDHATYKEYTISDITQIEAALAENRLRYIFGVEGRSIA